jgi:hypothetical protein
MELLTPCKTSHASNNCPQCQYSLHWITLQINNHEYQAHYKTCMQSYKSLQSPHMWNPRPTQLFQSKSVVSCVIASVVLTTKWRCPYQRMWLICRLTNLLILMLMQVVSDAKWNLNAMFKLGEGKPNHWDLEKGQSICCDPLQFSYPINQIDQNEDFTRMTMELSCSDENCSSIHGEAQVGEDAEVNPYSYPWGHSCSCP